MQNMTRIAGRVGIDMPATTKTIVPDSYMDLINEFPLRRIKTASDHSRAKRLLIRLSGQKIDRSAAQYLEVLVDLITNYEQNSGQTVDNSDLSAADLVRHRIEQRGMSVSRLAREIGIPQSNLSEMLSGKRDWSKTAIRALAMKLNIPAVRFLR
jgi:antitoxin component HigA of HigAB toxin-antitoxin module